MAVPPAAEQTAAAVTPEQIATQRALARAYSRRGFLGGVAATAGAAAITAAAAGCTGNPAPYVDAATQAQADVLNFVLNLEYLEATFYAYIVTGKDLDSSLTGGGPTPTGAPGMLTFPNNQIADLFAEIYFDESSHVSALRTAIGQIAVPRPQINLAALGTITTSNYLQIARLLEDVGVTAYAGAAAGLDGTNITAAAQILAVEGFHAGALRLIAIQTGTPYPSSTPGYVPADGFDVKPADPGTVALALAGPTTANGGFFATAANGTPGQTNTFPGFAYQRTSSQVLAILFGNSATGTTKGGFFPNGISGNITTV